LATHEFDGHQFIKVSRRENWLCQAITGRGRCQAPLARVSILEKLRMAAVGEELVAQAEPSSPIMAIKDELGLDSPFGHNLAADCNLGIDGPPPVRDAGPAHGLMNQDLRNGYGMDQLGLDELGLDAVCPVPPRVPAAASTSKGSLPKADSVKKSSRGKGKRKTKVVPVTLGEGVAVRVLSTSSSRQGGFVQIHVEDLPHLIASIRHEFLQGGESFRPEDHKSCLPYFSARDNAWCARARRPDGTEQRKSFGIPKFVTKGGCKAPVTHVDFLRLKGEKLEEAKVWIEAIERGEHVM